MARNDILGINARNFLFIGPHNPRSKVAIADSKIATKKLLSESGLPTPKLLGTITAGHDIFDFPWDTLPRGFVVKPNSGYGGGGIIIIFKRLEDDNGAPRWLSYDQEEWTVPALQNHVLNILDGSFSISNTPDIALFEEKVIVPNFLQKYTYRGVPDIRIVCFNRVPVMAMLRLPTRRSHGKANVAQGAIALGIDLASGVTTNAMMKKPLRRLITQHPDTKEELQGLQLQYWDEMLTMASEAQNISGLGFLGVDIAIDKYKGPQIIEINARPGLDVQVANLSPLRSRMERIKGLKIKSTKQAIRISKELFGGDIERRVEDVTGLQIIGPKESVEIRDGEGNLVRVFAKIDTGQNLSLIDAALAEKLQLETVSKPQSEFLRSSKRKLVRATFFLNQEKYTSIFGVAELATTSRYPVVIGRRDLRGFLVDPSKKDNSVL